MTDTEFIDQVLNTWRVHDHINLVLLQHIPRKGFDAVPCHSRGRSVARVYAHMHKVRLAWLNHFSPGLIKGIKRFPQGVSPGRPELRSALRTSGRAVERFLRSALEGERSVKSFKRNPIRWMGYLISHESHHRGQIALALKQSGLRLPEDVALRGLWYEWMWGKR